MPLDYGIKISKSEQDVFSATGNNLIMSSSRNCLKVKEVQTTTMDISGGTGSKTISHGQSFTPICIVFITGGLFGDSYKKLPWNNSSITIDFFMYINADDIKISATGADDGTYTIYYWVSESENAN